MKKTIYLQLTLYLATFSVFAQQPAYHDLLAAAKMYCHPGPGSTKLPHHGSLDSAFLLLDSIERIAEQEGRHDMVAIALHRKVVCANSNNRSGHVYANLKKAQQILEDYPDELGTTKDSLHWEIQNELGAYFYRLGMLHKAGEVFDSMISELKVKPDRILREHALLIISYLFKGAIHKINGAYDAAIQNYNYAIEYEIEMASLENRKPLYGSTLGRLANVYYEKGDFKSALPNFKGCISYYEKKIRSHPERTGFYKNYITSNFHGLVKTYLELGQLDSAQYYLDQSLIYHSPQDDIYGKTSELIGALRAAEGDYSGALSHLQSSIHRTKQQYKNNKHFKIAQAYMALGDFYFEQKQWNKAADAYQMAIVNTVENFDNPLLSANPDEHADILSKKDLLQALNKKMLSLHQLGTTKKDANPLKMAWETGLFAIQLMDKLKEENASLDSDIMHLVLEQYPIFERMLEIGYQLEEKDMATLFQIIEKSKSVVLWRALQKAQAYSYAGIPGELLEQQQQLNFSLAKAEQNLHKAKNATNLDSFYVIKLKNEVFRLKESCDAINQELQAYTSFQQLTLEPVGLQQVQAQLLKENEAIIEYFYGEKHLYAFLISPNKTTLQQIAIHQDLQNWAATIKEDLFHKRDKNYIKKSVYLYQQLIAPFKSENLPEKLFIVPDGVLFYIPFEVLLQRKVEDPGNYATFPYFLKNHTISYCFSASLLDYVKRQKTAHQFKRKNALVIAPSFWKKEDPSLLVAQNRNQLDSLVQNQPEAKAIKSIWGGKTMLGHAATKEAFLKAAEDYSLIHLATHGKVNDQDPNYSFIAFTNTIDTTKEEFKLYVRELYIQKLQADLVVLSACETGLGKIFKGEGAISLSRGFIFAGAKSVVTSLWNVNDKATRQLMEKFYQNLRDGRTKDDALRLAKLDYLNSAEKFKAHPKYWAAFVSFGNMEALDQSHAAIPIAASGPIVFIIFVLVAMIAIRWGLKIRTT